MCIMEVRSGQHSSTIAQAMAHNTSTIERDLDMFRALLTARGETANLTTIDNAQHALKLAYDLFLSVYADEIARDVASHDHDSDHGNERVVVFGADAEIDNATATLHRHHDDQIVADALDAYQRATGRTPSDVAESIATIAAERAERYETR